MTLMDTAQLLGNFGEFVGAIAVVGTLIYLAIQVRHSKGSVDANTQALEESRRLAMAQAYQARTDMTQAAVSKSADSPYIAPISVKVRNEGLDALTDEERWRFLQYQLGIYLRMDNTHYQYEQGFIDDSYYTSVSTNIIRDYASLWDQLGIGGRTRSSFSSEIERILAEEGD